MAKMVKLPGCSSVGTPSVANQQKNYNTWWQKFLDFPLLQDFQVFLYNTRAFPKKWNTQLKVKQKCVLKISFLSF